MKRLLTVFKWEYRETVRSKPFISISIFLGAILLAMAIAALILGSSQGGAAVEQLAELIITESNYSADYEFKVAIDDRSGLGLAKELEKELPNVLFEQMELDDNRISSALENDVSGCVVLKDALNFDFYDSSNLYGSVLPGEIADTLEWIHMRSELEKRGVSGSDAAEILGCTASYNYESVGGYDIGKYIYNIGMVVLMFLVIALYGQMVATEVATEKGSRTMELLATSVSPVELLSGKVLGVGAAGLTQMVVFLLACFGMLGGVLVKYRALANIVGSILNISAMDIVWLCLYFVLGFLMMAFVYGGLGAMVDRVEDLSGVSSFPMYLFMIGYFIAIMGTSVGETGVLVKIASFVPFWSPIVMFSRMSIEEVPVWEVWVSLALLAATCAVSAVLSARLYRRGMLRYGKAPKLKELFAAVKK